MTGGSDFPAIVIAGLVVIASLALIGGLAAACFAEASGVVFLGQPRSERAAAAGEAPASMLLPMVTLAGSCAAVGLAAPLVVRGLEAPVALLLGEAAAGVRWAEITEPLVGVAIVGCLLLALVALVALARRLALAGKQVRRDVTWDCGYVAPSSRMQYTAASFAQPITDSFRPLLGGHRHVERPSGVFPRPGGLHTMPADPFVQRLFSPVFSAVAWAASRLRWLQQATIQVYILYIAVTVLVLLAWELR